MEWIESLSVLGNIYFWLGVVSSAFLVVQIVLMCFSSFGGDMDIDGDGSIDVDVDSGISIFTLKSITAFFAVGSWTGLLTYLTVQPEWVSIIIALIAGAIAMTVVVVLMHFILKLQCNGILQSEKLVGLEATVYVSIPAARSGRGKITLTAQGKFSEFDAVTDNESKLSVDEIVEIVAVENDCAVVKVKK